MKGHKKTVFNCLNFVGKVYSGTLSRRYLRRLKQNWQKKSLRLQAI